MLHWRPSSGVDAAPHIVYGPLSRNAIFSQNSVKFSDTRYIVDYLNKMSDISRSPYSDLSHVQLNSCYKAHISCGHVMLKNKFSHSFVSNVYNRAEMTECTFKSFGWTTCCGVWRLELGVHGSSSHEKEAFHMKTYANTRCKEFLFTNAQQ